MTPEALSQYCGVNVSRETFSRLDAFSKDFEIWADRINLVAPSTREDFWIRHIADSLQLLAILPDYRIWVDIGSGGGFPGLVIAIALSERSDSRVTLIESNRKKCSFLQMMKSKYAPQATIIPQRIEEAVPNLPVPQVVTARALAELDSLLSLTQPWLAKQCIGLFMKGREYVGEIEKSRTNWNFDLVQFDSQTAPDAAILKISNLVPVQR
ncbi:MAG: 16S rRNA (guanine(527)-N(7))-methyltransferase RsmG [Pseudomonadota bacterium]